MKINLIGLKFNQLTAIKYIGRGTNKKQIWLWRCDCGKEKEICSGNVKNGTTVSCGCNKIKKLIKRSTKHGLYYTSEYAIYVMIKQRCYNPKCKDYYLYGARGIKMCARWFESFENFILDMGRRPADKNSIDRINVDGDYEPANCRWATPIEQANNKRTFNKKLED